MLPKIIIPEPCHEDWSKMKPSDQGKFCLSCQKQVVDFTQMSDEELIQFIAGNNGKKVCGRFKSEQIQHQPQINVVIKPVYQTKIIHYRTGLFFSIALMLFASCSDQPKSPRKENKSPYLASQLTDSSKKQTTLNDSTKFLEILAVKKTTSCFDAEPIYIGEPMGIYVIDPIPEPYVEPVKEPIYEILPEPILGKISYNIQPDYLEGADSLSNFLKLNLKYPEYEKEIGIEGKLIIEIEINSKGIATNYNFIKQIPGSKNFENEVLRVLKLIPIWKPAIVNGVAVDGKLILPFTFELD